MYQIVVGSYLVGDQPEQQEITPIELATTVTRIAAAPITHNEVITTITPIAAVPASSADPIPSFTSPASFRGDA